MICRGKRRYMNAFIVNSVKSPHIEVHAGRGGAERVRWVGRWGEGRSQVTAGEVGLCAELRTSPIHDLHRAGTPSK